MGLPMDPVDPDTCVRTDGRNLADFWAANNPEGKVVTNADQLFSVDIANASKILGVFAPSHLPYHAVKTAEVPSLANMTTQAVRLLRKDKNGFLLMVSPVAQFHETHRCVLICRCVFLADTCLAI